MSGVEKEERLGVWQAMVERALHAAEFNATSDLLVLQAFLLYLLAMRSRARPSTWFSLMGIAVRIAQRIGLHRDGSLLGLPPVQAEERRRVWWQMQHMEILISLVVGCLSLTLYADWDTKIPANLEDSDFHPGMESLPPDRRGLTSISHCLWRYHILHAQREPTSAFLPQKDYAWLTSPQIPMSEKDAFIDQTSRGLSENYIQHCELLNPLHVCMQIGIRSFILALKRTVHQPAVANIKVSEIRRGERDDFLRWCVESLEYYVLGETTESVERFRWCNENYFQWTALVYVIIEAHHRATTPEAITLWPLIEKVYTIHPKLNAAPQRPDIIAIGRLIVLAWQQRQIYLNETNLQEQRPNCVARMEKELGILVCGTEDLEADERVQGDFGELDFDLVDWAAWERDGFVGVLN